MSFIEEKLLYSRAGFTDGAILALEGARQVVAGVGKASQVRGRPLTGTRAPGAIRGWLETHMAADQWSAHFR